MTNRDIEEKVGDIVENPETTGATGVAVQVKPDTILTPADVAAWHRVRAVLEALSQHGVNNVVEACQVSGVPRGTFYKDLQKPAITAKLLEWMGEVDRVILATVASRWYGVIRHQLDIATGDVGLPKDSTPAARFVQGVLDDARQAVEAAAEESGPSQARQILDRFKAQKVIAKRVTETIEVHDD